MSGNLHAFLASTDKKDESLAGMNPAEYYLKIANSAFPEEIERIDNTPGNTGSTDKYSAICKVKKSVNSAQNKGVFFSKLVSEEERYVYRWHVENESPLYKEKKILASLVRINISILCTKLFTENGEMKSNLKKEWEGSEEIGFVNVDKEDEIILDNEDIDSLNSYLCPVTVTQTKDYFFINILDKSNLVKACPFLYLDKDEYHNRYQFFHAGDAIGWRPYNTAKIYIDRKERLTLNSRDPKYIEVHSIKARYCSSLYKYVRDEIYCSSQNITVLFKSLVLVPRSENYLSIDDFIKKLKEIFVGFKDWKNATNKAHAEIEIMPDGYRGFYYEDNGKLASFRSGISLGGESGHGGYAMRADPLTESCYKYKIVASDQDKELATLLAFSMRFEGNNEMSFEERKGNSPRYFLTNVPSNKSYFFKTTTADIPWFEYYKYFNKTTQKRNLPDFPPKEPRINLFNGKNYYIKPGKPFFCVKTPELRKSKKGEDLEGIVLSSNNKQRIDAGSIMALALSDFDCYKSLQEKYDNVGRSCLPATSFAKFVIDVDETAKCHLGKDKNVSNTIVTDQEWCHLLGHGDGGREELDNFVCGSKHCNTEQLAIEIGLRRVTHSSHIAPEKLKNLKAKITAYLIPNNGTYRESLSETEVNSIRKLFTQKRRRNSKPIIDDKLDGIFFSQQDGNYKVKKEGIVKLLNAISFKKNKHDKSDKKIDDALAPFELDKLLMVRSAIRKKAFMYYPVADWMRFKIYYGEKKIFDHIYDGQSESISFNECQILDYTVERVVYFAMDMRNEYIDVLLWRCRRLFPKGELKDLIKEYIEIRKEYQILIWRDPKNLLKLEYVKNILEEISKNVEKINYAENKPDINKKYFKKLSTALTNAIVAVKMSITNAKKEVDDMGVNAIEDNAIDDMGVNAIDDMDMDELSFIEEMVEEIECKPKFKKRKIKG